MNVLDFALAFLVIQPLLIGLGSAGYRLQPRRPAVGLWLGIGALLVSAVAVSITSLTPYIAASLAGGVVGAAALLRRWAPAAAQWLAIGGAVVWAAAFVLVFLLAVGLRLG